MGSGARHFIQLTLLESTVVPLSSLSRPSSPRTINILSDVPLKLSNAKIVEIGTNSGILTQDL